MGNIIKKPTLAENYADVTLFLYKKTIMSPSVVASLRNDLKTRYEIIQQFKTDPNKLNDGKTLERLDLYNQSIKRVLGRSPPVVDKGIEEKWQKNYEEYKKTDEYKKNQEEIQKRYEENKQKREAAEREAAERRKEKEAQLTPRERQMQQQKKKRVAGVLLARYGRKRRSSKKKRSEFGRKRRSSKRRVCKK